jgi:hypothetical protein
VVARAHLETATDSGPESLQKLICNGPGLFS